MPDRNWGTDRGKELQRQDGHRCFHSQQSSLTERAAKDHSSPRGSEEVMKPLGAHRCLREALCFIPLRSCRIIVSSSSAAAIQQVTSSIAFFSTSLSRALKQDQGQRGRVWEKALYRWSLLPCCGNAKASLPNIHPTLQIVSCDLGLPSDRPQHAGTAGSKALRPIGFIISTKGDLSEGKPSIQLVLRSHLSEQCSPADFPATPQELLAKDLLLCLIHVRDSIFEELREKKKCQVGYSALDFLAAN